MNDPTVAAFLAGMITAGFLAGGLFFARFWSRSRDSLFMAFGLAFWLLAADQAMVVLAPDHSKTWFYLLRVTGFLLIAAAIVRKNSSE
jgi:peptidoglycan/LPS O-acetylase OafA/YrhL